LAENRQPTQIVFNGRRILKARGQALAHAKRAVELAGNDNAGLLDSLSAAYAELGDFEEAVRWQRKAVQIASDEIKDQLAAHLELYKQGQPYRDSR
jgi:tetratricopeptide (TPR) repeat protein